MTSPRPTRSFARPPGLHPVTGLLYLSAWTGVVMFTRDPALVIAMTLGAAAVLFSCSGWGAGLRALAPAFWMMIPVVAINAFFHPGGETVLVRIPFPGSEGGWAITAEGLAFGFLLSLKLAVIVALGAAFARLVRLEHLLHWLSRWMPRVGLAGIVSLLSLPRIGRDMKRIALVMESRGVRFASRSPWLRTVASVPLWKGLLVSTLEGSMETAEALHARGFGTGKRSVLRPVSWGGRDAVATAATAAGLVSCLVDTSFLPGGWLAAGGAAVGFLGVALAGNAGKRRLDHGGEAGRGTLAVTS